jgi:hypothetical protein
LAAGRIENVGANPHLASAFLPHQGYGALLISVKSSYSPNRADRHDLGD